MVNILTYVNVHFMKKSKSNLGFVKKETANAVKGSSVNFQENYQKITYFEM